MNTSRIPQRVGKMVAISSLLVGVGCASQHAAPTHHHASPASHAEPSIVATAASAGKFSTLVTAIKAAGLVDTLEGDGPFTVFAPTDAAFAKLPPGTLETLLKPENKEQLISILSYHVVAGELNAEQVTGLTSAQTLQGQRVAVAVNDRGVRINEATVVQSDIECANGVIHVIDRVILPN